MAVGLDASGDHMDPRRLWTDFVLGIATGPIYPARRRTRCSRRAPAARGPRCARPDLATRHPRLRLRRSAGAQLAHPRHPLHSRLRAVAAVDCIELHVRSWEASRPGTPAALCEAVRGSYVRLSITYQSGMADD